MRLEICDDEDYQNQGLLYAANADRSMKSRRGQRMLVELRDALLAMPVKELHADLFVEQGENAPVCALGAWAVQKVGGDRAAAAAMAPGDPCEQLQRKIAEHGWPWMVAAEVIFQNDDSDRVRYMNEAAGAWQWRDESPAERYRRVLRWVEKQILPEARP